MAREWSKITKPHRVLKVDVRGDYQRGEDVRALQSAANRRLRSRGLTGYVTPVDGVYGPDAALACRKATWALGALLSTVRPITRRGGKCTVGAQRMIRYPGRRTSGQLARAKARLRALRKARTGRDAAVRWARSKVGIRENPPGSNRGGEITRWQQQLGAWLVGTAWCGTFCAAALRHAGARDVNYRLASVAFIEDDARAARGPFTAWTHDKSRVHPGDLVVIGGRGVHVELVVRTHSWGVETVGGNTSPGNGSISNGGAVASRSRPNQLIHGFAVVDF